MTNEKCCPGLNCFPSYFELLLQGRGRTVKNLHGCCTFSACFTSFCNFALLNLKLVTIGSGAALVWMTTNKCCPPGFGHNGSFFKSVIPPFVSFNLVSLYLLDGHGKCYPLNITTKCLQSILFIT